ncbi:MAG TPA: hypothetical protein VGQ58_05345 [Candidatus Limnocylindrales bacterium]|jgi:hypothetical protein|nr:hypothetical protein [Candidatus Limnocylindrales bacterium]
MGTISSKPVRFLRATGLAAMIAMTAAGLASAKMPYFTIEVVPDSPTADEPVLIVVRMWADVDHTVPADWDAGPTMDDLLVLRSSDGKGSIPVGLRLVGPDRYEATITLPSGDWRLVAFPDRSGWITAEVPAGYPDSIALAVRERGPDLSAVAIPLAATALVLLGAYSLSRLRSAALTRSSSVDETPTSASAARDASRASPSE